MEHLSTHTSQRWGGLNKEVVEVDEGFFPQKELVKSSTNIADQESVHKLFDED